jgi:hypothetical protein
MPRTLRPTLAAAVLLAGVLPAAAQQSGPPAPTPSEASLEALARDGFEVKAITQAATTRGYVVMLQRGTEVRTCLLRIRREANGAPERQSVCF